MAETTVISGQPNLANLLKKTKNHPKGRVTLDEETGEVKNPKTKITSKKTVTIKRGEKIEDVEIPVYSGHATSGGVWRSGFEQPTMDLGFQGGNLKASCPQELYHLMAKASADRKTLGKNWDFLPELTEDEMRSYFQWRVDTSKPLTERETEQAEVLGVKMKKVKEIA